MNQKKSNKGKLKIKKRTVRQIDQSALEQVQGGAQGVASLTGCCTVALTSGGYGSKGHNHNQVLRCR
jgi:hypothetical protein